MFFTQKTFVQRRLSRHVYFYKNIFCTDTFKERGFYTPACFLTRTHLGRGTLTWKHGLGQGSNHLGFKFPAILFLERCVYIQGLLHREGPSHRDGFLQRDDFKKGCFYLQMLLHRDTFNTEMLLHTGALRYKYFYAEMILLRETFSHRRVFSQVPLHLCTQMFLHRCFYMLILLQYTVLYAHILLRW